MEKTRKFFYGDSAALSRDVINSSMALSRIIRMHSRVPLIPVANRATVRVRVSCDNRAEYSYAPESPGSAFREDGQDLSRSRIRRRRRVSWRTSLRRVRTGLTEGSRSRELTWSVIGRETRRSGERLRRDSWQLTAGTKGRKLFHAESLPDLPRICAIFASLRCKSSGTKMKLQTISIVSTWLVLERALCPGRERAVK